MHSSKENLKTVVYAKVKGAEYIMGDLRIDNSPLRKRVIAWDPN